MNGVELRAWLKRSPEEIVAGIRNRGAIPELRAGTPDTSFQETPWSTANRTCVEAKDWMSFVKLEIEQKHRKPRDVIVLEGWYAYGQCRAAQ